MKTRILLSTFLLLTSVTGFCTTWEITNNGNTFTQSTITIALGDEVNFTLSSIHNALEVSEATWNVNGSTALSGGFETPFGGGLVTSTKLTVGTHYYVCSSHFSTGMKGKIIVSSLGVKENQFKTKIVIFPNPAKGYTTINFPPEIVMGQVNIYDNLGRVVRTQKFSKTENKINTSELSHGSYLLFVRTDYGNATKILIVD